ncbi:MAG: amidohydrolase family protein, partial [Deltaproteobacteria bacterium]|nr:amidohydrolase family protein [Deltaproteobacteria bacterium]
MAGEKVDLVIKGGRVLTLDPQGRTFNPGQVVVDKGRIVDVGPEDSSPGHAAEEVLEAGGGLILPGLINCHTHAAMTLFRGLADDLPLEIWLNEHIFPAEAKLNQDLIEIGTRLACAEMILGGTTCFCDMYLWEDTVARAVDQAGLRAVVGEVLYDFPSPHYGQLDSGFDFTRDFITHYQDHARISVMVMPHALYTCSPDLLRRAKELALETGVDLHLHLGETMAETAQVIKA